MNKGFQILHILANAHFQSFFILTPLPGVKWYSLWF
jgi:hypothetical protein